MLYRQTYKDKAGTRHETATWWVQYYVDGRRVRESTGTTNEREAKDFLAVRVGRAAEGRPLPPRLDKVTYAEVAADLRVHYETTGARGLKEAEGRLHPLNAFFRGYRAPAITPAEITKYVAARQATVSRRGVRPANGTINRELAVLGRVFRVAYKHGKLLRVPVIDKLKEGPPRAGFFEPAQYEAVRRRLRPDLRVACDLAYTLGWRVRDEVLALTRAQVDLTAGTVRLEPGTTKNDDGRVVYLPPALRTALAEQLDRMRVMERKLGRIIPWVFAHVADGPINPKTGQRRYQAGDRIRDFRRAWATACRRAGCPGMLRHDFRRTAVRNLVNDGTPEKVAMTITGHKTRSVFDRYHIVSPEDLKAAAARMAARDSHSFGHSRAGGEGNPSRKS